MDINDYNNLPDGMSMLEVEHVFNLWLAQAKNESLEVTLSKLDILSDLQWHSYELPSKDTRDKLTQWIMDKCEKVANESIDILLGACYCFGLNTGLYRKLLDIYTGESLEEFQSKLDKSADTYGYIDPYVSLK
jgi:hypothetical protein